MIKKRRIKNDVGDSFTLMVDGDLSGLSQEELEEYAFDAIWIKEQSTLRSNSNKCFEELEGNYTFKATPKGVRAARKPMSQEELVAYIGTLPAEDKARLLAQLK